MPKTNNKPDYETNNKPDYESNNKPNCESNNKPDSKSNDSPPVSLPEAQQQNEQIPSQDIELDDSDKKRKGPEYNDNNNRVVKRLSVTTRT